MVLSPERFCPHCFHDLYGAWTCKRRTCPSYAPRYLRDLAEVLRCALAEWKKATTIATLTAPGSDVLAWDPRLCKISGPHKHSGPNGCSVDPWEAAHWNRTVTRRLSRLRNRAMVRTRRTGVEVPLILACVLELKRGVFHAHVVVGYEPSPAGRAGLDVFLAQLEQLRGEYDFGTHPNGFDPGLPGRFMGEDAGRYISKYLRPDGAKGSFIPALLKIAQITSHNPETGRPTEQLRPVYVSPILTGKSGVTMRFLRWARYAYVVWGRVQMPRPELLAVYRLVREFGASLMEFGPIRPNPPPEPTPF